MSPQRTPDASKEGIIRSIDNCLNTLGPVGRIDQFEPARKDKNVPFEETLETIDGYVKSGKIGGISVSELGAETLRKAASQFKITSLEIELSLFRTEPITNGLLAACAELNIPVLAYCKPIASLILNMK
jgi:pyridoxine 4-dehydrogenase